jgi:hypothetical protein
MYLMAVNVKSHLLKWLLTVGIVFTFFSLSYFFLSLPGSDSSWFRGQTQYFMKSGSLDSSMINHLYFQWPAFFILSNVGTSVSGLGLGQLEFLQYALIGFLLATALYVYSSKIWKNGGVLAVVAFFVVMFAFLNYQDVPFSFALGLLFVLFMLEARHGSTGVVVTEMFLYVCVAINHAFVPLFFILYLLIQSIVQRSKRYLILVIVTSVVYIFVQLTIARFSFGFNFGLLTKHSSEYTSIVSQTFAPITFPLDTVAQTFSRGITIILAISCFVGFAYLLYKRRVRSVDKAILISGGIYSVLGFVLYLLGSRAFPILFIPVTLGLAFLIEGRFRKLITYGFLIVLLLIVFIPIHTSFSNPSMLFQTKEETTRAHFMIDNYPWDRSGLILLDSSTLWYIAPQIYGGSTSNLVDASFSEFQSSNIGVYSLIVFSTRLEQELFQFGISSNQVSHLVSENYSIIYNSGSSYIAEKIS